MSDITKIIKEAARQSQATRPGDTDRPRTRLAGGDLKDRAASQKYGGRQRNSPARYFTAEEVRSKAMKKLKKDEVPTGKTATGQTPEVIDIAPTKNPLTNNY